MLAILLVVAIVAVGVAAHEWFPPTGGHRALPEGPFSDPLASVPEFPRWLYHGTGSAYSIIDGAKHRIAVIDDGTEFSVVMERASHGRYHVVAREATTDRREAERIFDRWWLDPKGEFTGHELSP